MAEYGHDDEGAHKIEAMKAEMNAPGEEDFEPQRGWHSIYPLFVFNEPMESVWEKQPTFLIIEFLLLFLAAWGISDALKRRRGMLMFVACLVGGTAVELITVMHQEIGNFYHSQAVVMLFGRREPLYMLLGCYGWITYMAMVLADKYGCGYTETAAFAGLIGSEAWALLDTVGAQFIWWTWHNGEPLYADREGGVPVASSFWIMSSMAALAVCIKYCKSNHWAWGIIVGPAATLGLMHVPFTLIYHPLVTFSGLHASYAMNAFRAICLAPIALKAIRKSGSYVFKSPLSKEDDDSIIYRQLFIYVFGIVLVALACTPEDEYDKYKLLDDKCLNSYSEGDVESTWITVVGTAKDEHFDMLIVVHAVCVLGLGMLPF
eukprot:gene7042-10385_t